MCKYSADTDKQVAVNCTNTRCNTGCLSTWTLFARQRRSGASTWGCDFRRSRGDRSKVAWRRSDARIRVTWKKLKKIRQCFHITCTSKDCKLQIYTAVLGKNCSHWVSPVISRPRFATPSESQGRAWPIRSGQVHLQGLPERKNSSYLQPDWLPCMVEKLSLTLEETICSIAEALTGVW